LGVVVDGFMNVWWKVFSRCINAVEISEHIGWEVIGIICLVKISRRPESENIHPYLMD